MSKVDLFQKLLTFGDLDCPRRLRFWKPNVKCLNFSVLNDYLVHFGADRNLTFVDLEWPQTYVFWKVTVKSSLLKYILNTFDKAENLAFFDLAPKIMNLTSPQFAKKVLFKKLMVIWCVIWLGNLTLNTLVNRKSVGESKFSK